jgi:hypothetical protein
VRPLPGTAIGPPTTSPYLNLTRPGNRAVNYYNLVRPEFEFRNAYQSIQSQINRSSTVGGASIGEEGLPTTGHSTSFLNYSHFYPGPGAQSVTRQTTPAVAPRPAPGGRR